MNTQNKKIEKMLNKIDKIRIFKNSILMEKIGQLTKKVYDNNKNGYLGVPNDLNINEECQDLKSLLVEMNYDFSGFDNKLFYNKIIKNLDLKLIQKHH